MDAGQVKVQRQTAIRDLLVSTSVGSQDELRQKLAGRGFRVTQATLSRDIHDLKLLKGPTGYALPDITSPDNGPTDLDDALPAVADLLATFGREVRQAQNLLVLLTAKGAAQPVAAGIDDEQWAECLGTIAGDNTVLLICADSTSAQRLHRRLETYLV